jgi:hypothetical protein
MTHAVVRLGVTTAALALGACGGGSYREVATASTTPQAVAPEPRPVDVDRRRSTARFTAETNERMDEIRARLTRDIEHGRVSPLAMNEYTRQRAYLEGLLGQYGADQYIQDNEERHVRDVLGRMDDLRELYHTGRGGGP